MTTTLGRRRDMDLFLAHPIFFFFALYLLGEVLSFRFQKSAGSTGKQRLSSSTVFPLCNPDLDYELILREGWVSRSAARLSLQRKAHETPQARLGCSRQPNEELCNAGSKCLAYPGCSQTSNGGKKKPTRFVSHVNATLNLTR